MIIVARIEIGERLPIGVEDLEAPGRRSIVQGGGKRRLLIQKGKAAGMFVVRSKERGRALPPGLAPPRSSCRRFPSRLRANLSESRVGKRGEYRAAVTPPP